MKHALICILLCAPLGAEELTLREQLREALYTEEVSRDPVAAAKQYESLLADFQDQRALAATALFRLAEVRRKQDRKDDAIALYQRLLREFPGFGAETKLAGENLAALGVQPDETAAVGVGEESNELRRLQALAKDAPDILLDSKTLRNAVEKEWPRVVSYLLANGADSTREGVLGDAASLGRLDICKLLVERSKPGPEEGLDALRAACRKGRLEVLAYLLESGIDPNPPAGAPVESPLYLAIKAGNLEVAKLLLEHGADVDIVSTWRLYPVGSEAFGTPLHGAVRAQDLAATRFLLGAGADPDVAVPVTGITPLHVAARGRSDVRIEVIEALLKAGADPNVRTIIEDDGVMGGGDASCYVLTTPLELAFERRNAGVVKSLLHHGADPDVLDNRGLPLMERVLDTPGLPILRLLLAAKADPNVWGTNGRPMLFLAESTEILKLLLDAGADPNAVDAKGRPMIAHTFRQDWVEMLLEAGADPNLPFGELHLDQGQGCDDPFAEKPGEVLVTPCTALWEAAQEESRLSAFKALLKVGADPGPALGFIMNSVAHWDEDGAIMSRLLAFRPDRFNPGEIPTMTKWKPAAREVFLREVVYPEVRDPAGIGFLFLHYGAESSLATATGDGTLPPLAQLMLDHFSLISRPRALTGNREASWSTFQIVRRDDAGTWSALPLDLVGDAPFPELRWGDIITADPVLDPGVKAPERPGEALAWHLRKRITFPLTIEVNGETREFTLNGSRIVFDPTTNELPWAKAHTLASLVEVDYGYMEMVAVQRAGWDDIRVFVDGRVRSEVSLRAGDRMIVRTKADHGERNHGVTLMTPGFPYMRLVGETYWENPTGRHLHPESIPTLVQLIVDCYSPWNDPGFPGPDSLTGGYPASIAAWQHDKVALLPVLPSHPDLAQIRIRRKDADGNEEILPVDLAAAIAKCTDATSAEIARAMDVRLQAGDVVELPIRRDRLGTPWSGFNPEEVRFFRKALRGQVQVFRPGENPTLAEIDWKPTQWLQSPSGLLPIPPKSGGGTMRGSAQGFGSGDFLIERDGERSQSVSPGAVFLRDRDQLFLQARSSSRTPRVRVIPTAPSSSTSSPRVRRVPTPPKR